MGKEKRYFTQKEISEPVHKGWPMSINEGKNQ
jgi:hypothetical protein